MKRFTQPAHFEAAVSMLDVPQFGQQAVAQPLWSGQFAQDGFWAGSKR